ncbi:hypothetical protein DW322_03955 [Rhodococcus rhodnii]|uniref:Uncharacterized protein n=2 Tax=Rhodococcus rhodnii TaxID=38312 RepID=R7WLS6_9NOCA|nr:hypothetical protein [Rhodococcus rhodnii]EOM76248.1 hypothetical protein Rrhod_2407 [Rhodococcus rhodnii LMG 5362]TXG89533.1 hypothetical protein DW322_03955 [Rhodococcus rhodnii]
MNAPRGHREVLRATELLLDAAHSRDEQTILRLTVGPLRRTLLDGSDSALVSLLVDRRSGIGHPIHPVVDGDTAVVLFRSGDVAMVSVLVRSDDPRREPWLVAELGARSTGVPDGVAAVRQAPFQPLDRRILDEDLHALAERIRAADPHRELFASIDWNDRSAVLSRNTLGETRTVGDVIDESARIPEGRLDLVARTDETWLFVYLRELNPLLWLLTT